ncbi:hypothetical protein D0T53_10935 [Dysgonomonas sp. 216]|uniref:LPD38 domain-containing protein n=1 Tax=Dysgonomonas sp. 216 TaxID=2302934 RepID=UPI0013D62E36|nr:LPD38 domain-containing protein [Dysgonomonas sp. 216]NDW19419.1 hypothetical protein [Dysgonomonas sp. 216]
MPIYESNGKKYNIPDDRVNDFLSTRKDARLIDSPSELSNIESKIADNRSSTHRESNIQNDQYSSTTINSANTGLGGINPSFTQNQFNFNTPNHAENFGENRTQLNIGSGKPLQESISGAINKAAVERSNESDYIVGSAIDEYQSYKNWIDSVNNDTTISQKVKDDLNSWYNQNFRDTNNPTDDIRIPNLVREYLDKNKQDIIEKRWIPANRQLGESGYWQEYTTQGNSPEQLAMIADFLVNSPKGRLVVEDENKYLETLENSIDELEKAISEERSNRRSNTSRNIPLYDYLKLSAKEKEEYNRQKELESQGLEDVYPFADPFAAKTQLNELKKLRAAYKDGDKGAIRQMLNEFGRRLPYDLANAGSLGGIGLADESDLARTLEDPNNKLAREAYNLVGEYQQAHQLDRSIAQDIAQSTSYMLPFVAQFVSSEGIVSAATRLPQVVGAGKGVNFALRASETLQRPLVRMAVTPQLLTEAYRNNIENPGSFLDALATAIPSTYVEFFTEDLGRYIPEPKPKNRTIRKIMERSGVQGAIGEMAEEEIGMLLQPLADGTFDWSEFVNPRTQAVTAGTIAMMQLPYASIAAGGYAAGKARNVKQKRSIRKGYDSNLTNMNNVFGNESPELIQTINNIIDSDNTGGENINNLLEGIVNDNELTDKEKDATFKYSLSYIAMGSLDKAKQEQVEEAIQEIPTIIEENANHEMGAVVSATIAGMDTPVQITGGNIVQNEDGTINREQSDQEIYYTDAEGKRQVTSINYVENITENVPTQDAIAQVTEQVAAPIIAQQQNEEVRPYQEGETVRFSPVGNTSLIGQIEGQDQATGNYLLSVETPNGIQQMQVQPRQIINEDNIEGVENGSPVIYTNQNGEQVQDVVATTPDLYAQGLIGFENGDVVKIDNVIGLAQVNEQDNISNSQESTQETQQNEQSVTSPPSEQNILLVNEPRVFEIEEGLSAVENSDGTYSLDKQFAKSELKKADSLVKRLNEDYSDNGLLFETVQLPRKDASNPFEKPLWGVVARMQSETVSNPQQTVNENVPVQPLERKLEKSVKKDTRPKKLTPFQRRLQAVEPNVSSVRDRILYGIASGAYKFRWKDQGVSMGLARELGLTGSETERRSRISLLSNNGYTSSTLAHRIWEDIGSTLNDNDIRSEVIEVLSSISSPKQALETLESSLSMNEDTYYQEQQDAAEFEQEQIRKAQDFQLEISEQLAAMDIDNLLTLAKELGLSPEEIDNIHTAYELAEQIEQLEQIQNEETELQSGRDRTNEETDSVASRPGSSSETTERTVGERNRSSEETGDRISDRYSQNDYSDLTAEERRIVDETNALIDAEVNDVSTQLQQKKSELNAAKKRIGNAYAEDNQTNLFGQEQTSDTLFDVPRDFSQSNVASIIEPIQQEVNALIGKLNDLNNSRNERVNETLENFRSQGTIDFEREQYNVAIPEYNGNIVEYIKAVGKNFEVSKAESATNTNPTDAQKEAGNYKKGKVTIQGLDISIEQPRGSERTGTDESGKQWSVTMNNAYGYIRKTKGKDGDHIDVFLGANPESKTVFVVDQVNQDSSFDEHKVMLGFDSIEQAREAYLSNYEQGWQGLGNITQTDIDTFKKWANSNTRKIKPFAEYKEIQEKANDGDYIPFQSMTNEQIENVNSQFNDELQQQISGTLKKGHTYELGTPSAVLQSAGIPNLPIQLQASRLSDKSMQDNHPFDLSEVMDLPKAVQNPLAVFRSATHIGSYVIMTELEHQGKNYVVALQTNKRKGKIEINDIRSIHYRNSNAHMANWIEEGLLEYVDKKRMVEWLSKQRYNSAEVRKLFNHASKIVNDFENPKLHRTNNHFKPISEQRFNTLVDRLKQTGLANDVVTDKVAFDAKLDEVINDNATIKQTLFGMQVLEDSKGNTIGDGSYNVEPSIFDFNNEYPQITTSISYSNTTESTYVTYKNKDNDKSITVRFSNHENNAVKFGDQLNGYLATSDEILFHLGLKQRQFIPKTYLSIWKRSVSKKDLAKGTYEFADKTIQEMYSMGENADLSKYKGKIAKDSNYLILGDKVELVEDKGSDDFGNATTIGSFVYFMRTNVGDIYGFVTPDGTVYIDSTRMNANTPIHEFGHLWNSFTKENNAELYNRGAELVKESEYWQRVNDNPSYRDLSDDAKVDEALAMAIGDKGEAIVNEKGIGLKLKRWIREVWNWIGDQLGIRNLSSEQIQNLTLEQFIDGAVADILNGKKIKQSEAKRIVQESLDNGVSQVISELDISDKAYSDAIEKGDTETAQAIVDAFALSNGYITESEHRMNHRAPSADNTPSEEKVEEGGDFSLLEIAQGYSSQPSDYFDDPRGYMYDDVSGMESRASLMSAMRSIQLQGDNISEMPTVTVYRAVPKSLKEGLIRNGDWVTPSLSYANTHGNNALNGYYKIISEEIPANNLWWDGNDIREWGVDDNVNYAYKDTKNSRKLIDVVTYDNNGDIILPSKRFNSDINDIRFQSVNDVADAADSTMTEDMRNELDKRIKNFRFRIREAYEDRHLAVQKFLDVLRENGTEVAEHNDFYKKATHINGAIDAQLEQYNNKYQKPLNKAISELEKAGFDYRDIENYAILKHGLERNAWMKQDSINQYMANNPEATPEQIARFEQKLPDDFSGITAVEKEVGKHAEWFINDFEEKAGKDLIDNLWKRVKDATSYSLNKQLEGQLIDKKTIEDLKSRYDYYVPLRGHDAEVAEDRWDYSPDMGTYFVAPLLKAKGRKTRSESPFAYIASMAQSAINSANRNILNQTILRLARKDKTGMLNVDKAWYEKTGERDGKPVYEVRSPEYNEDPEIYRKNIEEFEERMAKLAEAGLAVQSGKKLDIGGLFIKRKQADQHEVHVFQNGTEYVVYINANPAVARAINGSNAKDLHKDLRFFARVSRQMAANFTTRNPIFVLSNFSRDYIFSSSILPVKENAKYFVQFQRNMFPSADALQRYVRGKADLNKQQDIYLNEYILNGAKTGFSHILELQKVQKQIERDIKKGEGRNVFRYLLDGLEGMNEFAENLSRLSVYITSREQGRSITQSVSDAKEVTVNFNRSGAGGLGAAWFRSLYLFVNAGIQALSNFAKVAQKNKAKTSMLISSYAMSGFLMPMLTALIGGDDGLDDYMKLSDWERQNNLCIYTGNGFIKIPLPHELRVFHKMGDEIYQSIFGKKDITQSLLDTALGFSDLIPANPMGAVDGSWADIMPDATKPFFQLAANRNFTGSRITNEWTDPNKPGYLRVRTNKKSEPFAPAFLVKLAEILDNATGGDGVEKGLISFNPDVVNHLMRGYFGGLYNMGMQGLDAASKTYDWTKTGELKLKVRETPLKTFYTSESDLQTSGSGLNTKYFKVVDDTQEAIRKVKGYKDQVGEGKLSVTDFYKKIENLNVPKANELYGRIKKIKKYESALKELDGQDQKDLEKIISDLKKEVIEVNNKLSE